jgi:hypothetical protein
MSLFVPLLEFNQFQNVNYLAHGLPKRVPVSDARERVTETKQRRDGEEHRGMAKFKSFWARSRHPLTPDARSRSARQHFRPDRRRREPVEDYYPSRETVNLPVHGSIRIERAKSK